jgi:large subunit ribosomal protein L27
MAHKAGQGSTSNGRDSVSKRRGVKKYGGEQVFPGNIIIRQCGTRWKPGKGVSLGRDYTIFSVSEGVVQFRGRFIDVVAPAAAN